MPDILEVRHLYCLLMDGLSSHLCSYPVICLTSSSSPSLSKVTLIAVRDLGWVQPALFFKLVKGVM